jgi:excisionase family DNA binding protein
MSTEINIDGPVSDGVPIPACSSRHPAGPDFLQTNNHAGIGRWIHDAEQAAAYVGVHTDTLRKWVRLGKFPRIPLPGSGKDFRFSNAMIDERARKRTLGSSR